MDFLTIFGDPGVLSTVAAAIGLALMLALGAALTDNRQTERKDGAIIDYGAGVDILYRGGLAVDSSGYAVAAADTASAKFLGVIYEKVDNSAGSAGDKNVRIWRKGIFKFAATGMAITDIGKRVYVSDDQTVTLVPGNVWCGTIVEFESSTAVFVQIDQAACAPAGEKIVVTASLSTFVGTRSGVAFICPAGRQATVLAAKVVAIIKGDYGTDELLSCFKYDLTATTAEDVLESNSYDLDGLTALQAADLTLQSTTPAHLDMEAGDVLYASVVCSGSETTAGDYGVTFEIALS